MKTQITPSKTVAVTALFIVSLFSASQAGAASCKGLEQAKCGAESSCSWVKGYERKDGRKVKAFCRTKASAKKLSKKAKDSTPVGG